jgi:hypothetical protein
MNIPATFHEFGLSNFRFQPWHFFLKKKNPRFFFRPRIRAWWKISRFFFGKKKIREIFFSQNGFGGKCRFFFLGKKNPRKFFQPKQAWRKISRVFFLKKKSANIFSAKNSGYQKDLAFPTFSNLLRFKPILNRKISVTCTDN